VGLATIPRKNLELRDHGGDQDPHNAVAPVKTKKKKKKNEIITCCGDSHSVLALYVHTGRINVTIGK
jgi:hypothetical protein